MSLMYFMFSVAGLIGYVIAKDEIEKAEHNKTEAKKA